MGVSLLLNLAAIAISVAAVMTSVRHSKAQMRRAREANHLPELTVLLAEFRNPQLREHFRYVCTDLQNAHPPESGLCIEDLSEYAREAVYDTAYFLQTFVVMTHQGILHEDHVVSMLNTRITRTWEAIKPYVEKERTSDLASPHLLVALQAFAERVAAQGERYTTEAVKALSASIRDGRPCNLL